MSRPLAFGLDAEETAPAAQSPLHIIFDNAHVVVVAKPAGFLSVPSRLGVQDARPCVGLLLQTQLGVRLWPAHRLDQEVSGLLMFARSAMAHRELCDGFAAHQIEKTYEARCTGSAPEDAPLGETRRWTAMLLRGKRRAYLHPAGKLAITDVKLVSATKQMLCFELKPRTGRPHQLRVELARRGCPIIGDSLYGSQIQAEQAGIALCAVSLGFEHFGSANRLLLPPRLNLPRLLS